MKALLLALFTFFIAVVSNAQIPAGTKLLGGSLGVGHQKQEYINGENKFTSINLNPTFGKAIKDNIVNGVSLSYNYYKTSSSGSSLSEGHSAGVSLYRQKYLLLGKSFMAFGQGNLGGMYGWRGSAYRSYGFIAGLGAGIAYNANNHLLLTVSIPNAVGAFVNYNSEKSLNNTKTASFNTGVSSVVSLQTFQFGILLMRK